MAVEERPMKRRRLQENRTEQEVRGFGLLHHLQAQLARTPPHRCGSLYRRLYAALQEERATPRLANQLSGLLLHSLEFVVSVRVDDDDDIDDFDETAIRLAHDIALCLQQVFVFSETSHGDEGGLSILSTFLKTLQLLEETSPETILEIVPRLPVRLFSQLPDNTQQQWVTAFVRHDAKVMLHSIAIRVSSSGAAEATNRMVLYAKVALAAINSDTFNDTIVRGDNEQESTLMEFFFWLCVLLQPTTPAELPMTLAKLQDGLGDPTLQPIVIQCLVLLSSPDRSQLLDQKQLMSRVLSVLALEEVDDVLRLHQATSALRNLLQDPEDYEACLSIVTSNNTTKDVLESLLRVSATEKDWKMRDSTVWGMEILWSLISYTAASGDEQPNEDTASSSAAHVTEISNIVSPALPSADDKPTGDGSVAQVTEDGTKPSPVLSPDDLVDFTIRAVGLCESDEYALYLSTRTICNDHADYFMALAGEHPQLVTALSAVLEDEESSEVVQESVLQFFQTLLSTNSMPAFTLARQDGVLKALVEVDPSILFLLSDAEENRALLANTPGVMGAMVRFARQHQEDNRGEEYRICRTRIFELAQFL